MFSTFNKFPLDWEEASLYPPRVSHAHDITPVAVRRYYLELKLMRRALMPFLCTSGIDTGGTLDWAAQWVLDGPCHVMRLTVAIYLALH